MLELPSGTVTRLGGDAAYSVPKGLSPEQFAPIFRRHMEGMITDRRWPDLLGRLRPLYTDAAALVPGVVSAAFEVGVLWRDSRGALHQNRERSR